MLLFTGHGFAPNALSGWEPLDYGAGTNWNGAFWIKILTASDITTGSVTITYAGSFNGVRAAIVFQGTPSCIRAYETLRNGTGSTTRSITTDATPRAGDYAIAFGSARVTGACTCNVGAQLRQVNASNASGVLNGGVLGANGAFTTTFTYPATPTGDWQAVVVVSA
jgi:hypothetical protein